MSNNPDNFLELLEASRLVPDDVLDPIRSNGSPDARQTGAMLVQQKLLSPWQLKVLENGESGPFFLASYLLLDQFTSGPLMGCFVARHLPSGHLVMLEFEPGLPQAIASENSWDDIVRRANLVSQIRNPNFLEIFETVSLPEYNFVVSGLPSGKPLAQLLADGKKSGSQQTARLIAPIAATVQAIHDAGTFHGNIDLGNIWLVDKNAASLRMPFWAASDPAWRAAAAGPGPAADSFRLACVTVRMWTGESIDLGRDAAPAAAQAEILGGEKMPDPIRKILCQMLDENPAARPPAGEIAQILARASGSEPSVESETPESLLKLRESIGRFRQSSQTQNIVNPAFGVSQASTSFRNELPQFSSAASGTASRRAKPAKKTWPKWAALAAMFALIAFAVYRFQPVDQGPVAQNGVDASTTTPIPGSNGAADPANPDGMETGTDDVDPMTDPNAVIAQKVIADDGKSLWESPTTGPRLNLAWLPPAPRMVFSIRTARLFSSEEGQRLIQAGGAGLESIVNGFTIRTGLDPSEVGELLVGIYLGDDPLQYRSVYVVHLKQPAKPEMLQSELSLQPAGDGDETESEFGQMFRRNDEAVFAVTALAGESPAVPTLVFGPADLVAESVAAGGQPALDGSLARLAAMTDNERTINALFVPAAVFNDAGQAMVGQTWSAVTGRLRTEFDETLRAGLISLNIDQDCYLELMLDHSVDLRPEKALEKLDGQLASFKSELVRNIAAVPSGSWWEMVRLKMDNMISAVFRNVRTGIENDVVIANCWLPPTAPHNLIASSEIALSFAAGIPATSGISKPAAAISTIDQLLQLPRDLEVTTNPDLGLLLQGIETEVNDQYGNLPFRFRIRMEGNDLVKKGITQNQRPGNFSIAGKPLAEILTEIMFRANPTKTATGPNDPLCELVWAIVDDPDQPGQKMVIVTTRTAATEREISLPSQFQPADDSGNE